MSPLTPQGNVTPGTGRTGPGFSTTVFVNATAATVNVGNAGSLAGIQGFLDRENEPDVSTINLNGQNDTATQTATFHTIFRGSDAPLGAVDGIAPGQIVWDTFDVNAVNVNLGSGTSTVNVQSTNYDSTFTPIPLNIFNSGPATINIGSNGSLRHILGPVNLENESGSDTVNINGQNDSATQTATLSTVTRTGDFSLGALTGVSPARITWDYMDTTAVNVNLGSGTSTVNVQGTGVTTNVFNSGPATVNVGNANSLAGILGQLNLESESSHDTVNINGQNDSGNLTATLSTVTRSGDTSLGSLSGLAPAQITWDYLDTTSVTINAGNGNDIFAIEGTGVPTTINAGTGVNIFRVSPTAELLANIAGALTLHGTGADTLEFFDQNNLNSETYTFDATPSSLSLGTVPSFSASFTGMSAVYLETNGMSTVNDASGSVHVDQPPP
jgi:hypothetical protein